MVFYDEYPSHLPKDAQYYFNVLVICIAIFPDDAEDILPEDMTDYWDLTYVTAARPYAFHIYIDDEIEYDWEMESFPHSVVEVDPDYEVSFYDMLNFDTRDPWRID